MEQKYLELCQRAKSVGALDYSPPPMRAVQGLSMTYEQLEKLVEMEVGARLSVHANAAQELVSVRQEAVATNFQTRVGTWAILCFGEDTANNVPVRNFRFYEESTELVQSTGMTREECHMMVDYTFDRPVGEPFQEVGGTMVTLAALCRSILIEMYQAGEVELNRINQPDVILKIRNKQASKPKNSPLPM